MTGGRLLAAVLAAALAAGLGVAWSRSSAGAAPRGGPLRVVAGEDVWGSIAAQLGGSRVHVTSIVAGPAADPHEFEPTAADARAVADAGLTIVNGAGYDPWLHELLSADGAAGRLVLTVADVAGVAVGASESVAVPLARALRLRVATPPGFLRAVAEGGEPASDALAAARRQIDRREIAVWILNGQNRTPDVQRLTDAARARGIPVVTVTETLAPAGVTFQGWQTAQLRALAAALGRGAAR